MNSICKSYSFLVRIAAAMLVVDVFALAFLMLWINSVAIYAIVGLGVVVFISLWVAKFYLFRFFIAKKKELMRKVLGEKKSVFDIRGGAFNAGQTIALLFAEVDDENFLYVKKRYLLLIKLLLIHIIMVTIIFATRT